MNEKPVDPNIVCPPDELFVKGYTSDEQSYLNTAKKDKYRLIFNVPVQLRRFFSVGQGRRCYGGNLERLHYSVWGTVIPEIAVGKIDKPYATQTMHFTNFSRPSYPPVAVNFTIDNTFDNYYVIWKWLDIISDSADGSYKGLGRGHIKDYSDTFVLQSLDENDKPIVEWQFVDAFPISIGSVNYQQRSKGEELETTFSFAYSQLHMNLV